MTQDKDQWKALVKTFGLHKGGEFLEALGFQGGFCAMQLV
jgi:hypothetical protein